MVESNTSADCRVRAQRPSADLSRCIAHHARKIVDPIQHHFGLTFPPGFGEEEVSVSLGHVKRCGVHLRHPSRHGQWNKPIVFCAYHKHGRADSSRRYCKNPQRRLARGLSTIRDKPRAQFSAIRLRHPVQHQGIQMAGEWQERTREEECRQVHGHPRQNARTQHTDATGRRRRHENCSTREISSNEHQRNESAKRVANHDGAVEDSRGFACVQAIVRDRMSSHFPGRRIWRMSTKRQRCRWIPPLSDERPKVIKDPSAGEQSMQTQHGHAVGILGTDDVEVMWWQRWRRHGVQELSVEPARQAMAAAKATARRRLYAVLARLLQAILSLMWPCRGAGAGAESACE